MYRRTAGEIEDFSRYADPGGAEARAAKLASKADAAVSKAVAKAERVEDPVKRAAAAEELVQIAAAQYATLVEIRNDAIRAAFDAAGSDRSAAAGLTRKLSTDTLLTPSQLRQVRSQQQLGTHRGEGVNWQSREVEAKLTEEYLRDARENRKLSMHKIAQETGVAAETVRRYMQLHELPSELT